MANPRLLTAPSCCGTVIRQYVRPRQQWSRSLVTVQTKAPERLDVPRNLPSQYWSQLPVRMRPEHIKRKIVIHEAPRSEREICKDPVKVIDDRQLALLDPTGARARLFHPENKEGAKVGDILLTTFREGEPFSGVIMSVQWRGPHTSVLVRNHITRIGTEMDIKIFSPLVQSMEIAQKTMKRKRRARLYYLRKPEHDVGSVQKVVDQYLKQRAQLTGTYGAKRQGSGKGGSKRR